MTVGKEDIQLRITQSKEGKGRIVILRRSLDEKEVILMMRIVPDEDVISLKSPTLNSSWYEYKLETI